MQAPKCWGKNQHDGCFVVNNDSYKFYLTGRLVYSPGPRLLEEYLETSSTPIHHSLEFILLNVSG